MIISENYLGKTCVLVDKNGNTMKIGEKIVDFRKDFHVLRGGTAPHKPGSAGKITTNMGEFYTSVFDLCWQEQI